MKGMYFLLQKRNMRFMKDNTRLYRMIKLLRLQVNTSILNPISQTQFALETLAEATISLQNPEAAQDAADFPSIGKAKEGPKDQQLI